MEPPSDLESRLGALERRLADSPQESAAALSVIAFFVALAAATVALLK